MSLYEPETLRAIARELDAAGGRADAWLGALQLLPQNADRHVRLELAALAVAASDIGSAKDVKSERIDAVVNSGLLAAPEFLGMEFDYDNPFTQNFTFIGGPYVVFPGPRWEISFTLELLLRTIFLGNLLPPGDRILIRECALAGLRLSHVIATRAGLTRNRAVERRNDDPRLITIPGDDELARLMDAVTFDDTRVAAIERGLRAGVIQQFVRSRGDGELPVDEDEAEALRLSPLVRRGDRVIAALPHAIVGAVLYRVIRLLLRHDRTVVATKLREVIAALVEQRLVERMHTEPAAIALPSPPVAVVDFLHTIDIDKLIHVQIATDDFDDWAGFGGPGWRADQIAERLAERDREVEALVSRGTPSVSEILHVHVEQPIGRLEVVPGEDQGASTLVMSAADLITLSDLEDMDALTLRQYARARTHAHAAMMVLSPSALGEFRFFRAHDYSYYASDAHVQRVVVEVGNAGTLRSEALKRRDPHAIRVGRGLKELVQYYPDSNIPIAFCVASLQLVVEGLPLPVWITPDDIPSGYGSLYHDISSTLAYWVWQLSHGLAPILEGLRNAGMEQVEIMFSVDPSAAWADPDAAVSGDLHAAIIDDALALTIPSSLLVLLREDDNRGERELLRVLLGALAELASTVSGGAAANTFDDAARRTLIDRVAPLGPKRHFLVRSLERGDGAVPQPRKGQGAESAAALDELGLALSAQLALQPGQVALDRRGAVFNKAVEILFGTLQAEVAALSPEGLLEHLVSENERVAFAQSEASFHLPSKIACFGERAKEVEELKKNLSSGSTRAIAGRFLIEYVVARPPTGLAPFARTTFDRLIALAGLLTNLGYASDAVYYGLSKPELALLPSGRLAWKRADPYDAAMSEYVDAAAEDEVAEGLEGSIEDDSRWDPFAEFDDAIAADWGFSLTEALSFLQSARVIGLNRPGEAKVMPLTDFTVTLAQDLSWTNERVDAAVALFSLDRRATFIPEPPIPRAEAFPWRFGRDLSYVRRPLLLRVRDDGAAEVIWGTRHTREAMMHVFHQLRDGRMKAKSKPLRDAIGRRRQKAGDAFVERVADLYRGRPGLVVATGLRKILGKRLHDAAGDDIGDIDVLVADVRAGRLEPLEVKNLALARTPAELHNQLEELFVGRAGTRAHAKLHALRTDWVRAHISETLSALGLSASSGNAWSVEPRIVLSRPQPSPYLARSSVPVVSYRELRAQLLAI